MTMKCFGCDTITEVKDGKCQKCGKAVYYESGKHSGRISFLVLAKAREGEPRPKARRVSFISQR